MTSVTSRLAGLVAATLVAAAGLVGVSSEPAAAAVCSGAGISAVVDSNDGAGGGIATACNRVTGSKKAAAVFRATGISMTRNPDGSVCKVNSKPANAECGRLGNQYWGLWWSNGTNGSWVYSQQGVDSLTVPKNGSVAWAWQGPKGKREPGVAPPVIRSAPATKAPTKKSTKAPQQKPTQQSGAGSQSTKKTPSQSTPEQPTKTKAAAGASQPKKKANAAKVKASKQAKAKAKAKASASPSARSSASESAAADPSDDASSGVSSAEKVNSTFAPEEDQGGLPVWVPIGVIAVLAGAAGGTALWRRRAGAP